MKTIGIIGGMGAMASVDLYEKITKFTDVKCDQEHIHLMIDSNSQIPDRTAFIKGLSDKNPLDELVKSAKNLKICGCDEIVLACNTAHFFADEIEKRANVKILHIASIASNALKLKFKDAKSVAIISTTATRDSKIYDKFLSDYKIVEISNDDANLIMDCIYKGVKANKIDDYIEIFNDLINRIDADVFIAGCTEIPLLLPYLKNKRDKFIDATEELAKFIVNFAKNN